MHQVLAVQWYGNNRMQRPVFWSEQRTELAVWFCTRYLITMLKSQKLEIMTSILAYLAYCCYWEQQDLCSNLETTFSFTITILFSYYNPVNNVFLLSLLLLLSLSLLSSYSFDKWGSWHSKDLGDIRGGPVIKTPPFQRAWVWSLVQELSYCKMYHADKKNFFS